MSNIVHIEASGRPSAAQPQASSERGVARVRRHGREIDLAQLARDAAAGDEHAWTELVKRHDRMLRAVARGYRLNAADAEDVIQTTWLRAWCHLDQLRNPAAISGWLVVTVRREAMRVLQRGVREVLSDAPREESAADPEHAEQALIEREHESAVRDAVGRLSGRQRQVVSCLLTSPAPSYEQLSARLEMPIGSIGPTRERALERLRRDAALRDLG